ncbi:unnamed protein product [Porites evermanni]|uniref:DDE Tnp4 domain-containing protein n=1 Tax=Porites evermanni TaxID=104178 RepID=A0ABN8ML86_9CNID|nr:unnamed protein product [Porites evermanni]
MSFKHARDALVLCHDNGVIGDEEFCLLYDANRSKNPEFPYEEYGKFDLEDMGDDECKAEFRFHKEDIPVLAEVLGLPETFTCSQGSVTNGIEGLCIMLKRFSYPCRYSDLIPRFGHAVPVMSMICNTVVDFVYNLHGHRITEYNHNLLDSASLQVYADAVFAKGAALDNCFGFVDGTVRPICRPGEMQRAVYNGHKRVHGLKFQSVALPNGLIANLFGPVEGRKHDASMLDESGLLNELERHAFSPTGQAMCIYGDPAYPHRVHLQRPFQYGVLTHQMQSFNESMSKVRSSVEWIFGDIINYFKFLDFKKDLKLDLSPIGKMYIVCALLRNALTCLYGNTTSEFFQLDPPSLEDYFA